MNPTAKIQHDPAEDHFTYLGMPAVRSWDVGRIVGRCHVGEPFLQVIRYLLTRVKGNRKGFLKEPKHYRRWVIAAAIQHHRQNRIEYRQVMGKSREVFVPRYYFDKETKRTVIAPDLLPADLAAMNPQPV